jgi:glutamate N-acetyltransferase/amino-acid N-acetyltransferase
MDMKDISGGVTAPKGFKASGVLCGIKKGRTKRDLGLIVSETRAAAAAVYTTNLVKGAPIIVTREHIADGYARAVIVNSGNANTCNGEGGLAVARKMCALAAHALGIAEEDVAVASTGVIGQPLPLGPIESGIAPLVAGLSQDGSASVREAIMTTDTRDKEATVEFSIGGKVVRMGGIAKGSGMIHPNMATMLAFITTDCAVEPEALRKAVAESAERTFNCVSVDGDTSTNDMLLVMANGLAGNAPVKEGGPGWAEFSAALDKVARSLSRAIAADGEGASRLLECRVSGAADDASARVLARSVISSSLVKAAFFGADANWGRILCAMGYSGAAFDPAAVSVAFESRAGRIAVCRGGATTAFDEEKAKAILSEKEIAIDVEILGGGKGSGEAFGCDLTYDYVKINGDYRS